MTRERASRPPRQPLASDRFEDTSGSGRPATWERVDRALEVRARLVVALDAIEDRNPGLAELCLLELLDDLDAAEIILGAAKRAA